MLDFNRLEPQSATIRIRNELIANGLWRDGMVLTRCVGVVQVLEEVHGEPVYSLFRVYPLGPVDPSSERGLLYDALKDSEAERRLRWG